MRALTALLFAIAASLFLACSFYQWRWARLYRRQSERLAELIGEIIAGER